MVPLTVSVVPSVSTILRSQPSIPLADVARAGGELPAAPTCVFKFESVVAPAGSGSDALETAWVAGKLETATVPLTG